MDSAMVRSAALLAVLLLISSTMVRAQSPSAVSCTTVSTDLAGCVGFIKGNDKTPSAGCCSGVKGLVAQVLTKPDREAACNCIKKLLISIGHYDPSRISAVPKDCGVPIVLPPVSNKTDCSKVERLHVQYRLNEKA